MEKDIIELPKQLEEDLMARPLENLFMAMVLKKLSKKLINI